MPKIPAYNLKHGQPTPCWPSLLRPSIAIIRSTGILTCFPSTTLSPRLRGRLTLSRLTLDRKPWSSGGEFFTPFIVTHVSIRTSDTSSKLLSSPSTAYRTLPYHAQMHPQLRLLVLAPLNLPRRPTRLVSYYAFFKGWLLLSQPPSCLSLPTSFPT